MAPSQVNGNFIPQMWLCCFAHANTRVRSIFVFSSSLQHPPHAIAIYIAAAAAASDRYPVNSHRDRVRGTGTSLGCSVFGLGNYLLFLVSVTYEMLYFSAQIYCTSFNVRYLKRLTRRRSKQPSPDVFFSRRLLTPCEETRSMLIRVRAAVPFFRSIRQLFADSPADEPPRYCTGEIGT